MNREVVGKAILDEAGRLGQEIHAMAISTTHVHIVVDVIDEPIETAVAMTPNQIRHGIGPIGTGPNEMDCPGRTRALFL